MAKPHRLVEQQPGDSMEALGEQLLREAREGQAAFVAGWQEFMEQLGVQGQPIGARQLREILVRRGINPDNNEFSRGIIAMREE
jgi:hypothetical protein